MKADTEKDLLQTQIAQLSQRRYVVMRGNPFSSNDWDLGEDGMRGMHLTGVTRDRVLAFVQENP